MKWPFVFLFLFFVLDGFGEPLLSAVMHGINMEKEGPDPTNQCHIHFNKSFYVSGENIFYKVYFPITFQSEQAIVTSTLYNSERDLVYQTRLRLAADKTISGYYKIPFEWTTGMYRMTFSVSSQKGQMTTVLAEAPIAIYNDFGTVKLSDENTASSTTSSEVSMQKDLRIEIQSDKNTYNYQESTKLKIKVSNAKGMGVVSSISLSVNDARLGNTEGSIYKKLYNSKDWNDPIVADSMTMLKGRVEDFVSSKKLLNNLVLAHLPKVNKPVFAPISKDGSFLLPIPEYEGVRKIELLDHSAEAINVQLETIPIPNTPLPKIVYTSAIQEYLNLSAKRKKIYQLYGTVENVSVLNLNATTSSSAPSDLSFRLDEYETFANIPDFFKEVLAPLKFRKNKKKKLVAKMYDPTLRLKTFFEGEAVFIVDGQFTADSKFIYELDISKVEQIDLFYKLTTLGNYFGPLGYNGVVMISSRNKDIAVPASKEKNQYLITGFQPQVNYPISLTTDQDIPRLSPNVFWSPHLSTDASGLLEIEIPNGMDASSFQIDVVAQDKNGNIGRQELTYEVKRLRN